MYLSRLTLNPRSRAVRRDLANCHDLHRTILRAFPQVDTGVSGARQQLGILFRLDTHPHTGALNLLVQSSAQPDWSALDAIDPHYVLNPGGDWKPIDAVYDRLRAGDEFIFRLRANPTRRVHDRLSANDPLHGKRVELTRENDQLTWLQRKAESGGFELSTVSTASDASSAAGRIFGQQVEERPAVHDVRPVEGPKATGTKNRSRLTFGSVVFEGRLRVTDVDRFRLTLEQGIGPAKAYGFGLLTIAPLR